MYLFLKREYNVFTEAYDNVPMTIAISEIGTKEDAIALARKHGWEYKGTT